MNDKSSHRHQFVLQTLWTTSTTHPNPLITAKSLSLKVFTVRSFLLKCSQWTLSVCFTSTLYKGFFPLDGRPSFFYTNQQITKILILLILFYDGHALDVFIFSPNFYVVANQIKRIKFSSCNPEFIQFSGLQSSRKCYSLGIQFTTRKWFKKVIALTEMDTRWSLNGLHFFPSSWRRNRGSL